MKLYLFELMCTKWRTVIETNFVYYKILNLIKTNDHMNEFGRNKVFLFSVTLNYFIRIMIFPNIKIVKKILSPATKMFYFLIKKL